LPSPFLTTAVVGDGGLTAGIDAYGDIVDLRAPGPAGQALIENPQERQAAGTVPADTGIVPRVSVGGGPLLPLWRADSVRQRYLPKTNVLRTVARFGGARAVIDCAAVGEELGCVSGGSEVSFGRNLLGAGQRIHLDDDRARQIVAGEVAAGRRWLERARPLGPRAPAWARRLYARSLLVMRALTDRRGGAVAAGARDGWAYVWPRDAGAVAIALAAAGYRQEARRVARFLLGLDLDAAARFDGDGDPVEGRDAQGDAAGWVAAAARATGLAAHPSGAVSGTGNPAPTAHMEWQNRADYQEKSPGDYLANAIAAAAWRKTRLYDGKGDTRRAFLTQRGLVREAGDPASGLDSAAAWAVRPFPQPALYPAVRRTVLALSGGQARGFGAQASRFGIVPSQGWPEKDPWTAPTAWSAWSLAALSRTDERARTTARDRSAALRLIGDLRRAATPAGLLPERVDAETGVPRSTTPLAWSHAFATLALLQLWPGRRQRESQ
jgi:hypothetical protein